MSDDSQFDGVIESAGGLLSVPGLLRQTVVYLVRAVVTMVEALAKIASVPFLIPLFGVALVGRIAQLIDEFLSPQSGDEQTERPQPFEPEEEKDLSPGARHLQASPRTLSEVHAAQAYEASVLAELDRTTRESTHLGQARAGYSPSLEQAAPAGPPSHSHVNQREAR